jgi:hypothetical protein
MFSNLGTKDIFTCLKHWFWTFSAQPTLFVHITGNSSFCFGELCCCSEISICSDSYTGNTLFSFRSTSFAVLERTVSLFREVHLPSQMKSTYKNCPAIEVWVIFQFQVILGQLLFSKKIKYISGTSG